MLHNCSDSALTSLPPLPAEACGGLSTNGTAAHPRLCAGLRAIREATCAQLASIEFMIVVVHTIGLVPDARRERLYGPAVQHMIPGHSSKVGLWQEPQQIAGAMIEVARRTQVQTYVEIGIFTAWTTTVMAAYMHRLSARADGMTAFRGFAVDITSSHITPGTLSLLRALHVSFIGRKHFDPAAVLSAAGATAFDLCFIDGDHSYGGVRADYALMASRCRVAMFHDIRDTSCLSAADFSGGVPLFWAHLTRRAPPAERATRVLELTASGSTWMPMFGIGLVLPQGLPQGLASGHGGGHGSGHGGGRGGRHGGGGAGHGGAGLVGGSGFVHAAGGGAGLDHGLDGGSRLGFAAVHSGGLRSGGGIGTAELGPPVHSWPVWKGQGPTRLWNELCAPPADGATVSTAVANGLGRWSGHQGGRHETHALEALGRGPQGGMPLRHPICERSTAADLQVMVRACKRTVRRSDFEAATTRWYGRHPAPNVAGHMATVFDAVAEQASKLGAASVMMKTRAI